MRPFVATTAALAACACPFDPPDAPATDPADPPVAWSRDLLATRLEAVGARDVETFARGPFEGARGHLDGRLVVVLLSGLDEDGREFACTDAGQRRLCVRVSDPVGAGALRDAIATAAPTDDAALLAALDVDGWSTSCRDVAGVWRCTVEQGDHVGTVELGPEAYVGRGHRDGPDAVYARMDALTAKIALWDAREAPGLLDALTR